MSAHDNHKNQDVKQEEATFSLSNDLSDRVFGLLVMTLLIEGDVSVLANRRQKRKTVAEMVSENAQVTVGA